MELRENKKEKIEDKEFCADLSKADLSRKEFVRVYAVDKVFTDVVFRQCVLTSCYFRNCGFINCDFTGASIKDCNFRGAQFEKCNFRYTIWEKTLLDERFLDTCLPSEENLARDLVRSLRTNFAQIGNYEAVNKAAAMEVKLTGQHLYNAAYSHQSYYRAKYKGQARLAHVLRHLRWKALELLWGNGESIFRVALTGLVVIIVVAVFYWCNTAGVSLPESFLEALGHFWGVQYRGPMPMTYGVLLAVPRYVLIGLFVAIMVKRLSRR
ncbi:MAG: pentapeptide repeat-containing protein [Desulfomonile tiedjei]|nr:pentapeptide repeat-containing protein [Desulfomonile tiedjei]